MQPSRSLASMFVSWWQHACTFSSQHWPTWSSCKRTSRVQQRIVSRHNLYSHSYCVHSPHFLPLDNFGHSFHCTFEVHLMWGKKVKIAQLLFSMCWCVEVAHSLMLTGSPPPHLSIFIAPATLVIFYDYDVVCAPQFFPARLSTVRGRSGVLWRCRDGDTAVMIVMKTSASLSFELLIPSPFTINTCKCECLDSQKLVWCKFIEVLTGWVFLRPLKVGKTITRPRKYIVTCSLHV